MWADAPQAVALVLSFVLPAGPAKRRFRQGMRTSRSGRRIISEGAASMQSNLSGCDPACRIVKGGFSGTERRDSVPVDARSIRGSEVKGELDAANHFREAS